MSEGEQILRMTEATFNRLSQARDPEQDAKATALYYKTLFDETHDAELVKTLTAVYVANKL